MKPLLILKLQCAPDTFARAVSLEPSQSEFSINPIILLFGIQPASPSNHRGQINRR